MGATVKMSDLKDETKFKPMGSFKAIRKPDGNLLVSELRAMLMGGNKIFEAVGKTPVEAATNLLNAVKDFDWSDEIIDDDRLDADQTNPEDRS